MQAAFGPKEVRQTVVPGRHGAAEGKFEANEQRLTESPTHPSHVGCGFAMHAA